MANCTCRDWVSSLTCLINQPNGKQNAFLTPTVTPWSVDSWHGGSTDVMKIPLIGKKVGILFYFDLPIASVHILPEIELGGKKKGFVLFFCSEVISITSADLPCQESTDHDLINSLKTLDESRTVRVWQING